MSALSTHHKRTKRSETKEEQRSTKEKNSSKWQKAQKRQEQSLTQAKIDPLRQGQRLDAIDQKPKHDSSKTEVMLDAVIQEAEGKRGNQEPKPKQKLPKQSFSLSQKSSPCSITSPKILPLVGTCTHQASKRPKAPPEAETPPEQMPCHECNAGGVSESIQGYKDMSNI